MITRKIGNLIRGKATPFHIIAATILGSAIAFIPAFAQAPGLLLFWLALLVVVNANLFVAGLVGLVAKLVALLVVPFSFAVGRVLLEGPTRGLFEALVNAPVFAWFGFDYFLVTGGQLVGLLFGLGVGLVLVRALRSTWRKLATLEHDSAAFQQWTEKRWVKISAFLFIGGVRGTQSYETLLARRIGNPVRILGVVLVVFVAVLGYVGAQFFDSAIVTAVVRSGLERANGATVDLEKADVDLGAGQVTLTALAMADPAKLETNLFAARTIEAKLSTSDLLRKRATIDSVVVIGGTNGEARSITGRLIGPPPETDGKGWSLPDLKSPEDLLNNAGVWKERLATVRRWLDRFSGSGKAEEEAAGPSYEEQLRARILALGHAQIRDESLVQRSPRLLVRRVEAGEVRTTSMPDDTLNIVALNLATEPSLLTEAPRLTITSASGRLKADVVFSVVAGGNGAQLDLFYGGLNVDEVVAQLKNEGTPPVRGGTMDVAAKGLISAIDSNLPVTATLRNTTLTLGGTSSAVAELPFPFVVHGPIDHPGVKLDAAVLQKVAGSVLRQEGSRLLLRELDKVIAPSTEGTAEGQSKDAPKDAARGLLDGLLRGQKKETPAPAP